MGKKNDYGILRNFSDDKNDEVVFMDYDEVKDYIILRLNDLIKKAQNLQFSTVLSFVRNIIITVQEVDDEFIELSGEKKNKLVTDIVTWIIYDRADLDIPYVPDFIEKPIFKIILSKMIIPYIVDQVKNRL